MKRRALAIEEIMSRGIGEIAIGTKEAKELIEIGIGIEIQSYTPAPTITKLHRQSS
jgi:hypothetical protein